MIAASTIYTIKKHGPDRIVGLLADPRHVHAQLRLRHPLPRADRRSSSSASTTGTPTCPPPFPETWGEQTDVCESADWYNSKYIVVMGSNLNMTRTPDVHFVSEARHAGAKLVVLSPDFSQVSKYADWWLPVNAGQDGAFWMAADHVILKEFFVDRQVPYFIQYLKRYTDLPFLVRWRSTPMGSALAGCSGQPGGAVRRTWRTSTGSRWCSIRPPARSGCPPAPSASAGTSRSMASGTSGMEDGLDGTPLDPALSLLGHHDDDRCRCGPSRSRMGCPPSGACPFKYVNTRPGRVAGDDGHGPAVRPVRGFPRSAGRVSRRATTTTHPTLPPGRRSSPASTGPPSSASPGSSRTTPSGPRASPW